MGSPLKDRRTAFLVVGVVAAAIYLNSLANLFAYDDNHIILNNTALQSLETLPGALLEPYWPGPYGQELGLWRPVSSALYGLQWMLWGGEPLPFHAVNVVMHVVASLLVVLLLADLLPLAAAFAAGLVFAVHPVHVEAVANVIGLSELLSTICVLGAALVHVRAGPRSGWGSSLAIGALYAVGFGAKESAVTLPGLIFLLDAARGGIGFRDLGRYLADRWRVYAVMLVVAVGLLAARYSVLGSIANPFAPLGASLLLEIPKIWTLGEIWMHYVRLWVFPLDLSSDYSPGVIPISFGWHVENVLGVSLAITILILSLVAWRRRPVSREHDTERAAAFGIVWFMIAVSPTSNTLFLSGVLLAERTLYLPSVGLAAATGWLVVRLARDRRRLAWGGLTVAVLASSVRVWTRNPTWRDTPAVMETLLRDYPQSGRAQWILGDQFLFAGRVSQGLVSYRAAIDLLGTHYAMLTEISRRLMDVERYRAAEVLLRLAAGERPEFPLAYQILALVRSELGDAEGTERYARQSLELDPFDPTRLNLLAWSLAAQGRMAEAAEARERADEIGRSFFWQSHMYDAYAHWHAGDTARAYQALDSVAAWLATDVGRATVDSVKVAEFGFDPDSTEGGEGAEDPPAR